MLRQQFRSFLFRTRGPRGVAERRILVGFAVLTLIAYSAVSQTREAAAPRSPGLCLCSPLELPTEHVRAFPRAKLGNGHEVDYVGAFCSNASYKKSSGSGSRPTSMLGKYSETQTAAPRWMILSAPRVVEDFPTHATKVVHPISNLAAMRDAIVTLAYGRPRVMGAPDQLTTDSMLRVVISDPEQQAVHVFDPKGKTSFSILGEQGRRLRQPSGVAVDAEDNIYIADSELGMVLVYSQYGQFVRYIGNFHGENMYERPTGIAIDRKTARLYLADTPRNLVFILDLEGNVLKRIGKNRDGTGSGEFVSPTQIAVSNYGVVVLDTQQSRIQVLDFDGNLSRCYHIVVGADKNNALSVDQKGDMYVSYVARSIIGMYKPDGTPMGAFGQAGSKIGEFGAPRGLWVDGSDRLYVADAENARVQIFQVSPGTISLQ